MVAHGRPRSHKQPATPARGEPWRTSALAQALRLGCQRCQRNMRALIAQQRLRSAHRESGLTCHSVYHASRCQSPPARRRLRCGLHTLGRPPVAGHSAPPTALLERFPGPPLQLFVLIIPSEEDRGPRGPRGPEVDAAIAANPRPICTPRPLGRVQRIKTAADSTSPSLRPNRRPSARRLQRAPGCLAVFYAPAPRPLVAARRLPPGNRCRRRRTSQRGTRSGRRHRSPRVPEGGRRLPVSSPRQRLQKN
jgi:hypothetical protein